MLSKIQVLRKYLFQ